MTQTPTDPKSQLQGELLELLLDPNPCYPWNPADAETETYLAQVEAECPLVEDSDPEIEVRAKAFFTQLEKCWQSEASVSLYDQLKAKFGAKIPQNCLSAIAAQAEKLAQSSLSPLDRLIECTKPLLSQWAIEDLQVFARPLAYSMRSGTSPEVNLPDNWEKLPPVEQAKYTLQIASYALDCANAEDT